MKAITEAKSLRQAIKTVLSISVGAKEITFSATDGLSISAQTGLGFSCCRVQQAVVDKPGELSVATDCLAKLSFPSGKMILLGSQNGLSIVSDGFRCRIDSIQSTPSIDLDLLKAEIKSQVTLPTDVFLAHLKASILSKMLDTEISSVILVDDGGFTITTVDSHRGIQTMIPQDAYSGTIRSIVPPEFLASLISCQEMIGKEVSIFSDEKRFWIVGDGFRACHATKTTPPRLDRLFPFVSTTKKEKAPDLHITCDSTELLSAIRTTGTLCQEGKGVEMSFREGVGRAKASSAFGEVEKSFPAEIITAGKLFVSPKVAIEALSILGNGRIEVFVYGGVLLFEKNPAIFVMRTMG